MKKFILFTVVLYVLFLVSFKENSREPESFAKILKDNPERLTEFLKVASLYKDTNKISEKILSRKDIISKDQLEDFREKMKPKPGQFWTRAHPVIIISTQALNELIKNHLNKNDSIVFYLGNYNKNIPERISRYNERNGGANFSKDNPPFTIKNLKKRPAFAMQVFSTVSQKGKDSKNNTGLYNPQNIIGAVGKGNHDVEMNNSGTNNFKLERMPVSEIYEISRLCPPPREGCFDNL